MPQLLVPNVYKRHCLKPKNKRHVLALAGIWKILQDKEFHLFLILLPKKGDFLKKKFQSLKIM